MKRLMFPLFSSACVCAMVACSDIDRDIAPQDDNGILRARIETAVPLTRTSVRNLSDTTLSSHSFILDYSLDTVLFVRKNEAPSKYYVQLDDGEDAYILYPCGQELVAKYEKALALYPHTRSSYDNISATISIPSTQTLRDSNIPETTMPMAALKEKGTQDVDLTVLGSVLRLHLETAAGSWAYLPKMTIYANQNLSASVIVGNDGEIDWRTNVQTGNTGTNFGSGIEVKIQNDDMIEWPGTLLANIIIPPTAPRTGDTLDASYVSGGAYTNIYIRFSAEYFRYTAQYDRYFTLPSLVVPRATIVDLRLKL